MNDNLWVSKVTELADHLIEKMDDFSPEPIHVCPVCGTLLKVQMGRYRRYSVRMIGVTIECPGCDQAIAIDAEEGKIE